MAIRSSNQITFTEQKTIVEIREYYLATSLSESVTIETEGWTTTPQAITAESKYLWNYEEVIYSIGNSELSEPIIIGVYTEGVKGDDGKSISDIINYYATTQEPSLPSPIPSGFWQSNFSNIEPLSSTNKYLWNYELFVYTDGTTNSTDPAIIGVYGDSGQDAVTFQIYSIDGLQFKEDMTQIELKTVAAMGDTILSDVTYQWSYLNTIAEQDGTDSWIDIEGANGSNLIVEKESIYAFNTIRCVITYDGEKVLEDYITLTQETVVYSATVNFFGGSNVFQEGEEYIVAYASLYRNGVEVDSLITRSYYTGDITISDDGTQLTAPDMEGIAEGAYDENSYVYFIYKATDAVNYQIVLGQFNPDTQVWNITPSSYMYDYVEHFSSQGKMAVISKNQISGAQYIEFTIHQKDTSEDTNLSAVASASATIFDINDPIISSDAPTDAKNGQLWLDTSTTPSSLKMWNESEGKWVDAGYQNGGAIYTSKPESYNAGDLWILAADETCTKYVTNEAEEDVVDVIYTEGSLLKANTSSSSFDEAHWEEAVPGDYSQREIMRYYMNFDKDIGLIIGKRNEEDGANGPFYTLISDTEMGFYDNSDPVNYGAVKVVHIGSRSAKIKQAQFYGDGDPDSDVTVELGNEATFYTNTTFNEQINAYEQLNMYDDNRTAGFSFQIEDNGSFSLVVME